MSGGCITSTMLLSSVGLKVTIGKEDEEGKHCPAREYHMTKEDDAQCLNINIVIAF